MTTTKKSVMRLLAFCVLFTACGFFIETRMQNHVVILKPYEFQQFNKNGIQLNNPTYHNSYISFEPELGCDGLEFCMDVLGDNEFSAFKINCTAIEIKGLDLYLKKELAIEFPVVDASLGGFAPEYSHWSYIHLYYKITTTDLRMAYKTRYGMFTTVDGMFRKFKKATKVIITINFNYVTKDKEYSDSVTLSFIPAKKVSWRFIDEAESI